MIRYNPLGHNGEKLAFNLNRMSLAKIIFALGLEREVRARYKAREFVTESKKGK